MSAVRGEGPEPNPHAVHGSWYIQRAVAILSKRTGRASERRHSSAARDVLVKSVAEWARRGTVGAL